jgi:hypothetical protein
VDLAATLEDSQGVVDIAQDDQHEVHLVGRHDYASVCTVRGCLEVPAGFQGSQDIELLANNFLVNTEIEGDTVPSCNLHAVAACVATVDQDSLALVVDRDLSFVPLSEHPGSTVAGLVLVEFLVENDYLKVLEASVDFVL